jgi:hypothetical protein
LRVLFAMAFKHGACSGFKLGGLMLCVFYQIRRLFDLDI